MRSAIWTLVLCTAVAAGAQELTITSKVSHNGGAPDIAKSYISPEHVRMSEPNGNAVIFDLKSGDMTILNTEKKTYYIMTQKDIDDMMAMVQEQMKNIPPEMQQRMQSMMGGAMQTEVKKTGTSRTVAGYKCENWLITIGQHSEMEQCVTTDLKLPAAAWERFRKFNDRMRAMSASRGAMMSAMDKMREELAKVKGFPLASTDTTTIMGKKSVSVSEVTDISHGAIPASAWTIPSDYKKVENPIQEMMQRQRH